MDTKASWNTHSRSNAPDYSSSANLFPERSIFLSEASNSRSDTLGGSTTSAGSNTLAGSNALQPSESISPTIMHESTIRPISHSVERNTINDDRSGALFGNSAESNLSFDNNVAKSTVSNVSLISRVAQKFGIFRTTPKPDGSMGTDIDGIFKQSDRVDDLSKTEMVRDKTVSFNISSASISGRKRARAYKELIISSTPAEFHSIDPNSVFEAKRRRTLNQPRIPRKPLAPYAPDHASQHPPHMSEFKSSCEATKVLIEPDQRKNDNADQKDDGVYFCSPTIESLASFLPSELSEVSNFIVGRAGFGHICFDLPVDLTAIFADCAYEIDAVGKEIFGHIIKIEDSVVRVYDDIGMVSPEMGRELNVPATITLKVRPKECDIEHHIQRLKNKSGMEFITYDPVSFNWTFRVQHFSVWGLIDDGEDEADESDRSAQTKNSQKKGSHDKPESPISYSSLYQNEKYQNELKRQKIDKQTEGIPGGWKPLTPARAANKALGERRHLVQYEINREVGVYKEKKFTRALAANMSDITSDSEEEIDSKEQGISPSSAFHSQEDRNYDYLKGLLVDRSSESGPLDLVDEKAYEPSLNGSSIFNKQDLILSSMEPKNWLLQLEIANSVDSALMPLPEYPKSQQVNMNSINDILFSKISEGHNASELVPLMQSGNLNTQDLLTSGRVNDNNFADESLHRMIQETGISTRINGFPKIKLSEPLNFDKISEIFKSSTDFELLRLASILFDKREVGSLSNTQSSAEAVIAGRLEDFDRKSSLASWLKDYNGQLYSNERNSLDDMFSNLCFGNLESAVQIASTSDHSHLAALISLLGSNDSTVRKLARDQIEQWDESGTMSNMPSNVQNIFRLLAGQWDFFQSKIPGDMLFGLHVFYANTAADIYTLYAQARSAMEPTALSEILRIHSFVQECSSEETGRTISASSLSSKLRWLLALVFSSKADSTSSFMRDSAIISLGDELEQEGLWGQAIYVYSSSNDNDLAKRAIRNLLIGRIDSIVGDGAGVPEYFTSTLKVPTLLVHEAQAVFKSKRGDMWGSAEEFMAARLWHEAHAIICDILGPTTAIEENPILIARILSIISKFPEGGRVIPEWTSGAGFYARYFEVLEIYKNQNDIRTTDIRFLLDNVINLKGSQSPISRISKDIISRNIGNITL